jgi:FkbM family methyltransferase
MVASYFAEASVSRRLHYLTLPALHKKYAPMDTTLQLPIGIAHPPHGKLISRALRAYFNGPDHVAKLRLWSQLRRLTGYRRLTIPYAGGGYLTIDERDWLQRLILATGAYEPEVWSSLIAQVASGEILWDIGAHIGTVSVRAVLDARFGEVHSFEADPVHAKILGMNLALNGSRWTVHNVALSDETKTRSFRRATGNNSGMSSLQPTSGGEVIQVQCKSIDDLVFREGVRPPTLVKIDVEGWELHVLLGARRLLAQMPPRKIVFESASDRRGQIAVRDIPEYLADFDYELQPIRRPSGEILDNENYCATLRSSPRQTPYELRARSHGWAKGC